ncbi:MAG TPA: hypothetical protein VLT60_00765 [Usitatibacter sp.]|nr:hypothetical protein [Usitatibacter sp.]
MAGFARSIALLLAVLACGCSSMPLSTLGRGASFNESTFAYVDARALRVKVSLPEGFVLDAAASRLVAVAHSSEGTKRTELALDPLGTGPGKRGGGMWSSEVAVTSFEMDLTEDSVKALRELQREVATGKVKDVQLEVKVRLGAAPPGATSARLWVDLLMSPIEGYFPLIDGGTVAVERAKT